MQKICLLLALTILLFSAVRAQVPVPTNTDSITQSLNQQFPGGHPYVLWRVQRVRQQLEEAVLDQQRRRIPLLLDYLTRTVPDTVATVQPREALSLLLAAGAYGPLLKRVLADKPAQAQQRYRQAPVALPNTLADIADFYSATHVEALTVQTLTLTPEESSFIQLLLEVLPRGGVSPAIDSTIQHFRQQYPNSPYGYVLKGFQTQEQVKAQLRVWHEREEQEVKAQLRVWQEREEREWQERRGAQQPGQEPSSQSHQMHFDGDLNFGTGFFTGSLANAFRLRYSFGLGSEFGFGRYLLSLRAHFGQAEVRDNFAYDGILYPGGNKMTYSIPEVTVGYRVVQGTRLALAPFIGAAFCDFTFPEQVSGTGRNGLVHVYLNRPLTTGFVFDYSPNKKNAGINWVLKIHGGVRSAEMPARPDINGAIFYLNAGIGYRVH